MMQKAMEKQALPYLRHRPFLKWGDEEEKIMGEKKGIRDDFEYCEICGLFHYKDCHMLIKDNRGKGNKRCSTQSIP